MNNSKISFLTNQLFSRIAIVTLSSFIFLILSSPSFGCTFNGDCPINSYCNNGICVPLSAPPPPITTPTSFCGNGVCNTGEYSWTCPIDCLPPIIATPPPIIGTPPPIIATPPPIIATPPPIIATPPPLIATPPPLIATPPPIEQENVCTKDFKILFDINGEQYEPIPTYSNEIILSRGVCPFYPILNPEPVTEYTTVENANPSCSECPSILKDKLTRYYNGDPQAVSELCDYYNSSYDSFIEDSKNCLAITFKNRLYSEGKRNNQKIAKKISNVKFQVAAGAPNWLSFDQRDRLQNRWSKWFSQAEPRDSRSLGTLVFSAARQAQEAWLTFPVNLTIRMRVNGGLRSGIREVNYQPNAQRITGTEFQANTAISDINNNDSIWPDVNNVQGRRNSGTFPFEVRVGTGINLISMRPFYYANFVPFYILGLASNAAKNTTNSIEQAHTNIENSFSTFIQKLTQEELPTPQNPIKSPWNLESEFVKSPNNTVRFAILYNINYSDQIGFSYNGANSRKLVKHLLKDSFNVLEANIIEGELSSAQQFADDIESIRTRAKTIKDQNANTKVELVIYIFGHGTGVVCEQGLNINANECSLEGGSNHSLVSSLNNAPNALVGNVILSEARIKQEINNKLQKPNPNNPNVRDVNYDVVDHFRLILESCHGGASSI